MTWKFVLLFLYLEYNTHILQIICIQLPFAFNQGNTIRPSFALSIIIQVGPVIQITLKENSNW